MARLLALPTYRQPAPYETPRLFSDAQSIFIAGAILCGLGLASRIVAMSLPEWVVRGIVAFLLWGLTIGALLVGVLLVQSRRRIWTRKEDS